MRQHLTAGMGLYYCCPSLEAVKQLLAMAVQHVCPRHDVADSAWRQWIQLVFQAPSSVRAERPAIEQQVAQKTKSIRSNSALNLLSAMSSFNRSTSSSPTGSSSTSVATTDTVVSVHPSW